MFNFGDLLHIIENMHRLCLILSLWFVQQNGVMAKILLGISTLSEWTTRLNKGASNSALV